MARKILAAVCVLAAFAICGGAYVYLTTGQQSDAGVVVVREGGHLDIPVVGVRETASFYPVEVDGVRM